MSWQDIVIAVGQIIFVIALLPTVFGKDKPAFSSSLITGAVMAIYVITFTTLSLWLSVVFSSLTSLTWFVLAFQKYKLDSKI